MIKYLTLTLFLLSTARLPLEAMPCDSTSSPRIQVLPSGVHTYIWERPESNDNIELRLVIPVGLVHEREGEAGAVYTLANQMGCYACAKHPSLLGQTRCYDMSGDIERLDTTYFSVNIPHDKLYLLPEVIELFATWAWKWDPAPQYPYYASRPPYENDATELAIYAGREDFKPITSQPNEETLSEFYNKTYRSLPLAVVAVGAFDPDWVEELITNAFSSTPSGDLGPLPSTTPREIWLNQVDVTANQDRSFGESWIDIYLPRLSAEKVTSREQVTNQFLVQILNQRLSKALKWKDNDSSIDGLLIFPTKACAFDWITLECLPGESALACTLLDAELKKITLEGPSREELEKARTQVNFWYEMVCFFVKDLFDQQDLADSCIDHFRGVAPLFNNEFQEELEKALATMTLSDVQTSAKSLKPLNQGRISVSLPRNEDAEAIRAQLEEIFKQ